MQNKLLAAVLGLIITAGVVLAGQQNQAPAQKAASVPTFTIDVAPIVFRNCVSCHRPGEIAPMSLLTYENARPYAKAIASAVSNRTMPPWHADAPPGTFHNERILTELERRTLIDWAAGGAPRGEPGDMPEPPTFAEGWSLGQPDVVLEMSEDYQIPASGTVQYEYFYVPSNFTETKWVQSIEIRPGNRSAVHHVLLRYRAKPDGARPPVVRLNPEHSSLPEPTWGLSPQRNEDFRGMPPRLVATYAPGTNQQMAPVGTAFRLEPGGTFEFQMHYTATGKPQTDRTKIGITFSRETSPREVRASQFFNGKLRLPAGASNVEVSNKMEFLQDATVWGLFPHTHVRGKRWEYKLVLPGGETTSILSVPHYDFNWQTYYMFEKPLEVPKGSRIVSTAWYDNSAANKSNPDPKADVFWGDQTWEEMQYTGILSSTSK